LSNLTADNRTNKSLFVKLNGVQILMQKLMMDADENGEFIEVAVSLTVFYPAKGCGLEPIGSQIF
jgi:hypothetical protein